MSWRLRRAVCECGAENFYFKKDLSYVHFKVEGKTRCRIHYIFCSKCNGKVVVENA